MLLNIFYFFVTTCRYLWISVDIKKYARIKISDKWILSVHCNWDAKVYEYLKFW